MIIVIMVVGKISRRVSLVRFPAPEELLATFKTQQKSVRAAVMMSSSLKNSYPALSSRRKSSGQSSLRHPGSNKDKSLFTQTPKSLKRKHSESKHASGSSDQSGKSKKKVKTDK
ncbi:Mediator-associated protein 2 [Raphanus sativus]|nr:Mediator-associated protein 2 [Raphanus sativus]